MKLFITIIQDEISYELIKALSKAKFRTTKLSSTGGFMKKGNTTLLIGTKDREQEDVLRIIKRISEKYESQKEGVANANIFVLNLEEHKRF
ncbi:MAG: cyclic-di-AMP receptor [Tissierellia bacterium]|nr:cyclic-di-AMP receptor [Tissierellia bacterium]